MIAKIVLGTSAALIAAGVLGQSAWAYSPATDTRAAGIVPAGSTLVCEGGSNARNTCLDFGNCPGGECTGISSVQVVARGLLTIIADTVTSTNWDETTQSCSEPAEGTPSDCETSANSVVTLTLEFSFNDLKYMFGQSYKNLPNAEIQPTFSPGWNEPPFESTISERTSFGGQVLIRWSVPPKAIEDELRTLLGASLTQRVALSRTDDVPICTDASVCNHTASNTTFADHSAGSDVQATVRRWKVDIAIVGP